MDRTAPIDDEHGYGPGESPEQKREHLDALRREADGSARAGNPAHVALVHEQIELHGGTIGPDDEDRFRLAEQAAGAS